MEPQGLAAQSLRVLLSNSVCRNVGFTARLTLKPVHTILLPASIPGKNRSNRLPGASGEDVQTLRHTCAPEIECFLAHADHPRLSLFFSFSLSLFLSLGHLFLFFSPLSPAFRFSFSGVPLFAASARLPIGEGSFSGATRNPRSVSSTPFPSSTLRADTASRAR